MRLAVRGELVLESPFLARDVDDEGPALALVAQPYRAHYRRDLELADVLVLPFDVHHRNFAYGNQLPHKFAVQETVKVLQSGSTKLVGER